MTELKIHGSFAKELELDEMWSAKSKFEWNDGTPSAAAESLEDWAWAAQCLQRALLADDPSAEGVDAKVQLLDLARSTVSSAASLIKNQRLVHAVAFDICSTSIGRIASIWTDLRDEVEAGAVGPELRKALRS